MSGIQSSPLEAACSLCFTSLLLLQFPLISCDSFSFILVPSSNTPSSPLLLQSPRRVLHSRLSRAECCGQGRSLATADQLPWVSCSVSLLGQEGATQDLHVTAHAWGILWGHFSEVCHQDSLCTQHLRGRWASLGCACVPGGLHYGYECWTWVITRDFSLELPSASTWTKHLKCCSNFLN